MSEYDRACTNALRAQGLAQMANVLTYHGFAYDAEQTGGMSMALTIYLADDTVTVVTGEGVDDYTVCRYLLAAWEGPGEPLSCLGEHLTRDRVIDVLRPPPRRSEPSPEPNRGPLQNYLAEKEPWNDNH